jgi:ParB family chromosome partitioning protein
VRHVTKARPDFDANTYLDVPLDKLLVSGSNVRAHGKTVGVDELARSVSEHGVLQPILVQPTDDGRFEILVGQRRYQAAKYAGLPSIPARVITPRLGPIDAALLSLSENVHRRDLSPSDKAAAIAYLRDGLGSVRSVAEVLGMHENTVRSWLGYAEVPEPIKDLVADRKLSRSTAINISQVSGGDEKHAVELANRLVESRPTTDERKRILEAYEEDPYRSFDSAIERAEATRERTLVSFVLPPDWYSSLQLAAAAQEVEPDDLARDLTIQWLRSHDF